MQHLKKIWCLLFLLPAFPLFAQEECVFIEWSKHYGGSEAEQANEVRQTNDGGYIVVGFSRSSDNEVSGNFGNSDYWVLKLDSLGNIEWEQHYGGILEDVATSVVETADGYLVAGGSTSSTGQVTGNHGEEDVWVLKIDFTGSIVWAKSYGGTANERAESMQPTDDGGFVLAGYSESSDGDVGSNHGGFDYWVLKINANGTILWEQNLGGSLADWGFDIRQTSDGGFVAAGSTFSQDDDVTANEGFYDYWVAKLDAGGSLIWQKNYGGAGEERAYALQLAADGSIVVTGTSISSAGDVGGNNGSYDYWAIGMNDLGDLLWSENFGGSMEDRAYALAGASNAGYLMAGVTASNDDDVSNNFGGKDAWLVRLNADGSLLWEKNYGGNLDDRFYDLRQTADGGYVCAGFSTSTNGDPGGNYGGPDFWVLKLTADSLKISLGNDTTLCGGDFKILELEEGNPDYTYTWQDGSTEPDFLVETEGDYWLEVDRQGCKARDTIVIEYLTATAVDLGVDTVLCEGETLLLSPEIPGANYLWKNGSTEPEQVVKTPGLVWVEVKKDGCEYRDSITVGFTVVEVDLGLDTFLCDGKVLYYNVLQTDATYLWQDGATSGDYQIATPGEYWVEKTHGGCSDADTIEVLYQLRPDTILPDFSFICEESPVWLDARQAEEATYLWQDGSTDRAFRAVFPGIYEVEVTLNSCPFRDTVELKPCERCLYIPNAFSPNDDGFNDFFQPIPVCKMLRFQMRIFDRWGSLVFETTTPGTGWNGEFKGKKATQGSYVYQLSFDLNNDNQPMTLERTGSVALMR